MAAADGFPGIQSVACFQNGFARILSLQAGQAYRQSLAIVDRCERSLYLFNFSAVLKRALADATICRDNLA